ncbi:protein bicaudal D [Trichonephila clavata]|uniref:Protein bicaudal D n=1 Tax=Trichonephila clavata TaxID=2740835 RepID=A0A8X6H487_TRICU|nr:protein bicaudal D [Trichonephila clavata]
MRKLIYSIWTLETQYGPVLLEEKESLQQRCEELESRYDSEKGELELLREALAKYQTNQKVTASRGIKQEESLGDEVQRNTTANPQKPQTQI